MPTKQKQVWSEQLRAFAIILPVHFIVPVHFIANIVKRKSTAKGAIDF